MKSLGVFGIISALLIGILGVYSCTVLRQFNEVKRKLQEDYVAAVEALQAIPAKKPPREFDKALFEKWLDARRAIAAVMEEGFKDKDSITNLKVKRVRNDSLKALADSLEGSGLSFVAYCELQRRWRSIIARPEYERFRKAWNEKVRVASEPEPLPLREPAAKLTAAEPELLATHEQALLDTLEADRLTVLLEKIEAGEMPASDGAAGSS